MKRISSFLIRLGHILVVLLSLLVLYTYSHNITEKCIYYKADQRYSRKNKYLACMINSRCRNVPFRVLPADNEKNVGNSKGTYYMPFRQKEIFLTFDDGPSRNNTLKILDILNENDIKATFFVIGKSAEKNSDIVKLMVKYDMCVLPHTYTHNYSIYNSVEEYFQDLDMCNNAIERITGKITAPFVRMPGGSDNKVSNPYVLNAIKEELKKKNIMYIDWNVGSGDASGNAIDPNTITTNVINNGRTKKYGVSLMHDSEVKTTSVEALPEIISFFKSRGYIFRTFNDITEEEKVEMINKRVINK